MKVHKKYTVYIIQADNGRRYIGLTENLEKRLFQYNAGLSRWTKRYSGWKVLYTCECANLSEARKFENQLKKQKGGKGLSRFLESINP